MFAVISPGALSRLASKIKIKIMASQAAGRTVEAKRPFKNEMKKCPFDRKVKKDPVAFCPPSDCFIDGNSRMVRGRVQGEMTPWSRCLCRGKIPVLL